MKIPFRWYGLQIPPIPLKCGKQRLIAGPGAVRATLKECKLWREWF